MIHSHDETARIAALRRYEVLDSAPEDEFDSLASLAALICGVSISAISLVDEQRIWFMSSVGLPVRELERKNGFCDKAIQSSELLEVADAAADPYFSNNPLVTGPAQIRFYAGQPLLDPDGFRLGTVCVLGTEAKALTEDQKKGLQLLSRQAVSILEGRLARRKVTKSLQEYQRLHDAMRDAFIQVDMSRRFLDANPTFCQMVGYSREECMQMSVEDFTPDEWLSTTSAIYENEILAHGFSSVYEKEYIHKDGHRFPVEVRVFLVRDENDQPQSMWAIIRDISDRKRADHELAKREEKYRLLFENVTTGFALHEIISDDHGRPVDYRYLEVNPAFESLTGLKSSDLLGKTILEVVPGTEQYWIDVFGRVALTGEPTSYENYSAEIGKYFNVWVFCPKVGQFAVVFSDTTATKLIEAELRSKERRLSLAISATSDAIWEWNIVSGETYYSPRWYEMLGYEDREFPMTFDVFKALCHPDDFGSTTDQITTVLNEQRSSGYQAEFRMKSKSGDWIWILGRGNVVERDPQGGPVVLSGTNTDITDRKAAENALRSLNETLENRVADRTSALAERNEDLEFFSYAISHDLRAPLRVIEGCVQALVEDHASELSREAMEWASRIGAGALQMAEMLDGILAYSRIGTRRSEPYVVSIKKILDDLVDEVQTQPEARKVEISTDIEDVQILLDSEALSICVRNLIQNAVKFSVGVPEPSVVIESRTNEAEYVIEVRDNGVGFDMADSERIFQMFRRLRPSAPGTGVGLALVARAISRMGGVITTSSSLGQGASFTIKLPMTTSKN